MEIYESIISLFNVEEESSNLDSFLKEEVIEMSFDLEAKSLCTFKSIGYY